MLLLRLREAILSRMVLFCRIQMDVGLHIHLTLISYLSKKPSKKPSKKLFLRKI